MDNLNIWLTISAVFIWGLIGWSYTKSGKKWLKDL